MPPKLIDLQDEKLCNDSVHGYIKLPPICVKIIDTPQFQRLRNIKQLGGAYYVYPGASHNRFEHSIGVCYLAGELVKKLKASQSELEINDEDVLCVQIAGLCHDLGHGPFSHLFDKHVIPKLTPPEKWKHMLENTELRKALEKAIGECSKENANVEKKDVDKVIMKITDLIKPTKHEDASVMMLKHMLETEVLKAALEEAIGEFLEKNANDGKKDEYVDKVIRKIADLIKPPKHEDAFSVMVLKHMLETEELKQALEKAIGGCLEKNANDEKKDEEPVDLDKVIRKIADLAKYGDASVMMLKHMLEKKELKQALEEAIGECLEKNANDEKKDEERRIMTKKEDVGKVIKKIADLTKEITEKKFLYEIVANERTKIDVDKWDYFIRDCHHLGLKNGFDHQRLIEGARVIDGEICYRDKEELNLFEMFHTRHVLHRRAYQHKTTLIIENMIAEALRHACSKLKFQREGEKIAEALRHACSKLKFQREGEKVLTLGECIYDPVAYTSLDDTVLWLILNPRSEEEREDVDLEKAREILQKIQRREHHRFITSVIVEEGDESLKNLDKWNKENKLDEELNKWMREKLNNVVSESDLNDIVIMPAFFDYGNGGKDPLEKVRFYSKHEPNKKIEKQASTMKPTIFKETVLYFYTKNWKAEVAVVSKLADTIEKQCMKSPATETEN